MNYQVLYETLEGQRARRGASWRQVAAEIGIPPGTFTRLKNGKGVADNTFATLMNWLDADESIRPFLCTSLPCVALVSEKLPEPEE